MEIAETQAIDDIPETDPCARGDEGAGRQDRDGRLRFGTCLFRNLRSLGVDMVKIDGAFVQNLASSLDDRFFVRTLASLARHLEIETVAEWVEDMEAARLLTEWGVDYLQGHVIGRALTPETTETEIRSARIGRTTPDH